jgi:hypothetical protein
VHTVVEAAAPGEGSVNLKVLMAPNGDEQAWRRRVVRLARLRASIDHPHLLPVIKVGESGPRLYLAAPKTSGVTLAERLRDRDLGVEEAMLVLGQVAGGLETSAAQGLLYRELTPDAIVVTEGEPTRALLGDFGIALPPSRGCELVGSVEGADYLSPEEIRGEPLEPQSNVYSLGCILVHCLTGAPPYPYGRPLLTLHAHLVDQPPKLAERRPELPAAIDEVVARALAKDAADRFQSPARLIRAARQALGVDAPIPVVGAPSKPAAAPEPTQVIEVAPPPPPSKKPAPRRRLVRERRPPARPRPASREVAPKAAPVAAAKRQKARPRVAAETRSATARRERRSPQPKRRRRGHATGWVALALVASTVAGFASGSIDWSGAPSQTAAVQTPAATAKATEQAAHVRTVSQAVARLDDRRAKARRSLRAARRPGGQAAAATQLAGAYRAARLALPAGDSTQGLATQLHAAEVAYLDLAKAARGHSARAWRSARQTALDRESAVKAALGTLQVS